MTAAGFPNLLVQIAFTTAYNDTTPTWVDVSQYVRGFSTQRGRPNEFSLCEPGTLSLELRNDDLRFDPENTSGPYYGYIRPMRRVRVGATVSSTYYSIFTGFVDAFSQGWENGSRCVTTVTATDRFKILARQTDPTLNSRPDEYADVRLTALLQHAGIGSADRSINPETLTARSVATHDYDGENLLQALQDIALADGGMLYMTALGLVRYQTVTYRQIGGATRARTSQARFGNDATAIPVDATITRAVDDSLMANKVTVTDGNGEVQTAEDTTARGDDGLLELDLGSTLLLTSDAADRVADLLALRKNPTPRFATMPVDLLTQTTADQATVLGLDFSDRLTLAIIPPGHTTGAARDQWVESIAHDVQIVGDPSWRVSFGLSSAGDAAVAIP
jgi:hypothetical protein